MKNLLLFYVVVDGAVVTLLIRCCGRMRWTVKRTGADVDIAGAEDDNTGGEVTLETDTGTGT